MPSTSCVYVSDILHYENIPYSNSLSSVLVPNWYGNPALVFIAGKVVVFHTLPRNEGNSESFSIDPEKIVSQEYITPCCDNFEAKTGHWAVLEERLFYTDGNVSKNLSFRSLF